jgi:hypothetical protein
MHERDVRAATKQFKGRFGRRVLAADHDNTLPVIGMRVVIVVGNVRQVFARHAEIVGEIVITDCEHDGSRFPHATPAFGCGRGHHERSIAVTFDLHDLLLECDLYLEGIHDPPVIAQGLEARRLFVRTHQRQPPDLEQLRRGEEHHVHREVEDRIDQDALLDDGVIEPLLLGGDGGGETGGARAYNKHVTDGHKE